MNTERYYNSKIQDCKNLIDEINDHNFTTAEQVIFLINKNIEVLEKCKAAALEEV